MTLTTKLTFTHVKRFTRISRVVKTVRATRTLRPVRFRRARRARMRSAFIVNERVSLDVAFGSRYSQREDSGPDMRVEVGPIRPEQDFTISGPELLMGNDTGIQNSGSWDDEPAEGLQAREHDDKSEVQNARLFGRAVLQKRHLCPICPSDVALVAYDGGSNVNLCCPARKTRTRRTTIVKRRTRRVTVTSRRRRTVTKWRTKTVSSFYWVVGLSRLTVSPCGTNDGPASPTRSPLTQPNVLRGRLYGEPRVAF